MEKLVALWGLFRKGEVVADPALWKQRQITVTLLAPLLGALAATLRSFGFDLGLSDSDLVALAGGVIVAANVVLTVVTSDKVGLPVKVVAVVPPNPGPYGGG